MHLLMAICNNDFRRLINLRECERKGAWRKGAWEREEKAG